MTIEASKVQPGTVLLVGAMELEIITAAPVTTGDAAAGTRVTTLRHLLTGQAVVGSYVVTGNCRVHS